jgi:hypothetical protein
LCLAEGGYFLGRRGYATTLPAFLLGLCDLDDRRRPTSRSASPSGSSIITLDHRHYVSVRRSGTFTAFGCYRHEPPQSSAEPKRRQSAQC